MSLRRPFGIGRLSALLAASKDNSLEIVFGERRYRASLMAGGHHPRPHRADERRRSVGGAASREPPAPGRSPDGRGRGLTRLLELKEPTFTVEQIAAKVGKTPAYITTRLKLTELVHDAAAAFYQEHIGVGHALLLAKLPADQQEQALAACFKEVYSQRRQAHPYPAARPQSAILD